MIKLKKLLAGVLGAAMMLASMNVTALAEEQTTPAAQTTPATIDADKKGSLTIHKYEYNGNAGSTGTGKSTDIVPEDANPLAGAGFTIYKVVDADGMTDYYSANPTALPDVSTYVDENGKIKDESKKVGKELITGTDGTVTFSNLDLGFYVVIETTTPPSVTQPVAPFIVSIPMTTVDGDDWLYDVSVFPKNGTSYGNITLEKTGNGNEKLAGVTFVLQKQNGSSWTNITKQSGASGDNTGADLNLTTGNDGKISVVGLSQGTYRFIEKSVGNNGGYILDGASTYEFTVKADATISYNGQSAQPAVTIKVKNEKPDLTKQVKDRTSETWKQDADYNVGDKVPYKITVDVPANITQLKEFTVTDTPTNLKDDKNSIELKCEGNAVAVDAYSAAEQENGFKITFDPTNMSSYAGKQIVITYKAELLSSAVTTTAGNPNTAQLEYSNEIFPDSTDKDNPNKPENPNEKPGKDVIKDNAIVYTFKLNIHKTGEDNANLQGVVFDFYKEVAEETTGTITGDNAKAAGLDSSKLWLKLDTLTTGTEGTVSKSGLANGTYYLVETKTNEGYNLLKAPVEVALNIAYTTSMTTSWEWTEVDGVKTLVKHEITTEKTTFENTDDTNKKDGYKTQSIINKKGFTLPTTGGMGSIIFIAGGLALAFAGMLIILASNRKKASK